MSVLPSGWATCALSDIADYVTSGSRDWSKFYADQGALFVRTENINKNRLSPDDEIARVSLPESVEGKRTRIRRDDILITITGANVGKCAHVDRELPEAYVSQSVALVRLKDCSLARFVQRQLVAPGPLGDQTQLQQKSYGLGRPVLSLENVRDVVLTIAPAREQEHIADKLDALLARVDACRTRLDRVPAILKRFRQATLSAAVRGVLSLDWRASSAADRDASAGQHVEAALTDKASPGSPMQSSQLTEWLADLPLGWKVMSAASVVEKGADIVYGIVQPGPKLEVGVPYVRGMDIVDGRIQVDQLLRTSPEIAQRYARASIQGGDVLLGIIRATKVAVVPSSLNGANITQGTARLRPSSAISTQFLAIALEAPETQRWLHAHYRGIDMPGLNLADVRRVPIPLPTPDEQAEIVRRVESLFALADGLEAKYQAARAQVDRLTPALLAKAFRGELVPQDPNDEPADALLARLRGDAAQHEGAGPAAVKRGRAARSRRPPARLPTTMPAD